MQYIYGWHSVMSLLEARPGLVSEVFVQKGRADERMQDLQGQLSKHNIKLTRQAKHEIEARVESKHHQGVYATCKKIPINDFSDLKDLLHGVKNPLLVILDEVQDPQNLGACLRSAAAFGALAIIIPKNNSAKLSSSAIKVSCGAALLTPLIEVTNISRTLKELHSLGIWSVGLDMAGEQSIMQADLTGPLALVLGGESNGMRRLTRQGCDYLAHIPMTGLVESLNVSVSCAIALAQAAVSRLV
jgi:23S rRNA (guanosine2251-2'-O)-methyltransferase